MHVVSEGCCVHNKLRFKILVVMIVNHMMGIENNVAGG